MGSASRPRSDKDKMFPEAAVPACLRLIDRIAKLDFVSSFHLVGGTALSLQLGHRLSEDLDFFSTEEFDPRHWVEELSSQTGHQELTAAHNDLRGRIDSVKIEFIYFAYPPHFPLVHWRGIKLLDARDIGMFKLMAVLGRNRKKDIVDLYFIDKEVMPLENLFREFKERYSQGDVNLFRQLETLFNDEEIALSQMPVMLKPLDWEDAYRTVKQKLVAAIKAELKV